MGFTKLDEGILKSSIMAEPPETFKVWIAFLAACDADGIARVSPAYVSSVCRLNDEVVLKAIQTLESPDKLSRSTEEGGRRIKRVDGGFHVINYEKYRAMSYSNTPEAVAKRKYRKKTKINEELRTLSGQCPDASASASASASGNSLHSLIVNRFYAFYEDVFKTKYTTNTREFRTLKEFLTLNPNMTIDRFKAAVENCFDNEFHKKHLSIHYICNNFSTLERLADDK